MFFQLKKKENKAFLPPPPPCNLVPLYALPVEMTNTSTLIQGGGRGVDCVFSEVTLFGYNVSTIFLLIMLKLF